MHKESIIFKKAKKSFRNIICIIVTCVLALSIYIGVKISKDPSFVDNVRRSIRTDEYFVKIEHDGVIEENKDNSPWIYKYDTTAYNKKGHPIKVSFYANKNLKKNAYICVYVVGTGVKQETYGVDSFEEVNENNVPELAKENLK